LRAITVVLCALTALVCSASEGRARAAAATRTLNGWLVFSSWDDVEIDGLAVLVRSSPSGRFRRTILEPPGDGSLGVFSEARWSPDGTKIALTFTEGNRYSGYSWDVYVLNADGTGMRRLVPGPQADRSSPTWSPDGTKLAYVESPADVHVVGADGSDDRRLARGLDPAWSPDGKRIAFARPVAGDDTDLYVVGVDGAMPAQLTSGPQSDRAPDWSPDGSKIAFQRGGQSVNGIYVIGSEGSSLRRLGECRFCNHPAWSPDGRKIAYDHGGDIWVMTAQGGSPVNITRTRSMSKDEQDPAWQPVREANGRIAGTRFADYLAGDAGRNVIVGGPGNDTILAHGGRRDAIVGGPGRDTAYVDRFDLVRGVERVIGR
jgi:Tol biopolymer transport system component